MWTPTPHSTPVHRPRELLPALRHTFVVYAASGGVLEPGDCVRVSCGWMLGLPPGVVAVITPSPHGDLDDRLVAVVEVLAQPWTPVAVVLHNTSTTDILSWDSQCALAQVCLVPAPIPPTPLPCL
jgi:hypothetical protein